MKNVKLLLITHIYTKCTHNNKKKKRNLRAKKVGKTYTRNKNYFSEKRRKREKKEKREKKKNMKNESHETQKKKKKNEMGEKIT